MLRALSRCILPGDLYRRPPAGPAPDQPPGTDLPLFVAFTTSHRRPCPHGRHMDGAHLSRPPRGMDIPSLPWERQHGTLHSDPPIDAPEPFRELLLSDRHPSEPPQP
ncbi:hypothetical protein MTO96_045432 [Rhipicephalus appendiculatus]